MSNAVVKALAEIAALLLLGALLAIDVWRPARRRQVALLGATVLLAACFGGLVLARFVMIAR
jgi:hypothetical protein